MADASTNSICSYSFFGCRFVHRRAFGGLQLVVCGDFFQVSTYNVK